MSDSIDPDSDPDPASEADAGRDIIRADKANVEAVLDAHGYDPSRYRWLPVLRKPRKDGWTPQRQVDFIAALADCGCVAHAAEEVCMSTRSCYRLRRESPQFAAAWDAALPHAARRLVDLAFDRAIHGCDEPVFDKEGRSVGRRMRQNDRLLMFLLRAYLPERFRNAHRSGRQPAEPLPPEAPPIAEILLRLEPAAPAEPHMLMAPEELDSALDVAEFGDGRLPRWHRGRGDAEPPPEEMLGPDFEARLEAAKREAAALPEADDDDEGSFDDEEDDAFLA